ncbi:hypothetical protein FOA52_011155 [Chlamydomonas sp. UWO 241]|nr:hypothetical protein FOA52_007949 [Chlamydomonas sp. UWO 241]KAG1670000.1 hypothetical protein FOA52_011155 [Chlamydomonas sp. UWO 241]
MMLSTTAASALALLLLACAAAAAVQQDCAAALLDLCLFACPDDSPLDACPLDASVCPSNSSACEGTAPPNPSAPASVPQSATFCPTMNNCSGAKLWCQQTLNTSESWDMAFSCSRETEDASNKYTCATFSTNCTGNVTINACSQHAVNLGTAAGFVVMAGASASSKGPSMISGNLGLSPAAGDYVTGFPPGEIVDGYSIHAANGVAAAGMFDLTRAYNDAAGRVLCPVSIIGNLGGMTLYPGLYKSTSGLEVTGSDLTLDARDDPDAVFIFQMASTFLSTTGRKVILSGGAQAKNVFWQVGSSGNLEVGSVLEGTMMADQSITTGTGAVVNGRVLARIASVTMDAAVFTLPA